MFRASMLHNTSMASQGGRSFVYITAGLVVGGLLTSAALFRMRKPRSPYRQITVDAGSSLSPAVSPDGALIAYSSDRAEPGNFDIWVQPLDAEGLPDLGEKELSLLRTLRNQVVMAFKQSA